MDKAIVKGLDKTELHCHLDGSLSLSVIRKLADMANVSLPEHDDDLTQMVMSPKDSESLLDYLKTFDIIRPLLQTKESLRLAAYDVAKQAADENVIYLELRFAPELSLDRGLTVKETVEAVILGLKQAEDDFGIVGKVLICGLKQTNPDKTLDIFSSVAQLGRDKVSGFDFAGNEADYPTKDMTAIIEATQHLGYPMTFHAGECGCVANVVYGLKLGIKRFGHGTALSMDDKAVQQFVESGATIEMCLTSNLQTKAAKTISDFPYPRLYQAGAKITINTDNRTVSNTTLTKEYMLFHQYFGTKLSDFYQFNRNAIFASFASQEEKTILLDQLEENYQQINAKML